MPVVRSVSVVRGQASRGIGEGPGSALGFGEQYLIAERPFDNATSLQAIRPWLTLDARESDHRQLGYGLEAWSCVEDLAYLIVTRLVSNPGMLAREGRASYFAHARGWPAAAMDARFDPGAWVGVAQGFDAPWPDGELRSPAQEPALVPPFAAAVAADPTIARRMLAWMVAAHEAQVPLVVVAPVEAYRADGLLSKRLGLARAALPLELKRQCRMRVFTTSPALFLRELRATVIATVPGFEAQIGAAAPRVMLVDEAGSGARGAAPPAWAETYAEAVVAGVERFADGLIPFSERLGRTMGARAFSRSDQPGVARALPVLYDLAFAELDPEWSDQYLASLLDPEADVAGTDWARLAPPGPGSVWDQAQVPTLEQLALDATRPEALRALAARSLKARGANLDATVLSWANERDPAARLDLVFFLLREQLVSAAAASALTVHAPLTRVADWPTGAELLRAELKQQPAGGGAFRRLNVDEVGRIVRGPASVDLLVQLMRLSARSSQWGWIEAVLPELAGAELERLVEATLNLVLKAEVSSADDEWLRRVLERGLVLQTLRAELGTLAHKLSEGESASARPLALLYLAEYASRAGHPSAEQVWDRLMGAIMAQPDAGWRGWLAETAAEDRRLRALLLDKVFASMSDGLQPWPMGARRALIESEVARSRMPQQLLEQLRQGWPPGSGTLALVQLELSRRREAESPWRGGDSAQPSIFKHPPIFGSDAAAAPRGGGDRGAVAGDALQLAYVADPIRHETAWGEFESRIYSSARHYRYPGGDAHPVHALYSWLYERWEQLNPKQRRSLLDGAPRLLDVCRRKTWLMCEETSGPTIPMVSILMLVETSSMSAGVKLWMQHLEGWLTGGYSKEPAERAGWWRALYETIKNAPKIHGGAMQIDHQLRWLDGDLYSRLPKDSQLRQAAKSALDARRRRA